MAGIFIVTSSYRLNTNRNTSQQITRDAGRRHQLRRHLSRAGHPIWGDAQHTGGLPAAMAASRAVAAAKRHAAMSPDSAASDSLVAGPAEVAVPNARGASSSGDCAAAAAQAAEAAPVADEPGDIGSVSGDAKGDSASDQAAAQAAERPAATPAADCGSGAGSESVAAEALEQSASGCQRLALWAVELRLRHPMTGEPLHLTLPQQAVLARECPELLVVGVDD